jgi:hypothetical protein
MSDDDGELMNMRAVRTGPVHGLIVQINALGETQFYGDKVVFDPTPVNELDHEDEDGNDCDSEGFYTLLFKAYRSMVKSEHFYFSVDGVYPVDEQWQTLQAKLSELGIALSRRSDESYVLFKGEEETLLQGVYAIAPCPIEQDLKAVDALLRQATAELNIPSFGWNWPKN